MEKDKCTPKGQFKFKYIFYRKKRVHNIHSKLKLIPIKNNFGWCDDVKSKYYNKFIKFPFKYKAEKLYRRENVYDIIVVIDYNLNPVKKNKGSAIFLHLTNNYKRTLGCIALKEKDMLILLRLINKKTKIKIL